MEPAIVGAIVQSVIPNLLQLIEDNHALISGNYGKIEELSSNLRLLHAFMLEYAENHYSSRMMMALAMEIKDLEYEVEDVLETYLVEVSLYSTKSVIGKLIGARKHLTKLKKIGEKVAKLTTAVQNLRHDNLGGGPREYQRNNATLRDDKLRGHIEADRIIGFDDEADEVLKLLGVKSKAEEPSTSEAEQQSESKHRKVVSIHGMLGIGKTTLARKVLNDQETEFEFGIRIFVSVTRNYIKNEVLRSILKSLNSNLTDQNMSNMSTSDLVEKVSKGLEHKYLVVVDDVWEGEDWDDLKSAFPDNKNGSRVLITTRNLRVAKSVAPNDEPYEMQLMKPKEAEALLRWKVFEQNKFPVELQSKEQSLLLLQSKEQSLLEKCNGLPLAIVVTGGILKINAKDPEWWQDVLDEVPPLVGEKKKERIDRYIRLSFDKLHPELKQCLLYLGFFPKNLEIQVSKVLQLWVAEGLIPQQKTVSRERMAEQYLRELVDKNLLLVGQRTLSGQMKTCRIHDTLRDFCQKTAEPEVLFQTIDANSNPSSSRRLCCSNSHFWKYVCGVQSTKKVRSFLSFGQDQTILDEKLSSNIFKPFKLLRVLDISYAHLQFPRHFPTKLPDLVLLKFIAINFNLNVLPKSLSSLRNLETLIVHTTEPTLDIQADIWAMTKLRHLHTNTTTFLPRRQRQSSSSERLPTLSLQNLSAVSPQSLTKEVFESTKGLKKLGLCGSLGTLVMGNGDSDLFDGLCRLCTLENLKLHSDGKANSRLLALPKPDKFPNYLKRLSLHKTSLMWNIHMPTLGKLQSLEVLKLKDNAFMGVEWKTEKGGFRSLKVLVMGDTNLASWIAKADDLKELRCLIIKGIKSLEQLPSDFKHLENLEKIDLELTNRWLVDSAKSIQKSRPEKIKLSVYPQEN